MNPKLRKLLSAPHLFVRDMIRKRVRQVRGRLPQLRKASSPRRYSVVSAVYGVDAYLDEFFQSMVRQSLDFERHVELVMVDDGSPDRSGEIIARWQAKYPHNIRYVRKENGGQGSARNLGLEHATGDWVTFTDPDDTVDDRYFERVDQLLARPEARDVILVGCKIVSRRGDRILDNHSLRSQFAAGDTVVPVGAESTPIQLSAASAFFRRDLLLAKGRRFDESIRPHFEDGHFIGRYLVENPGRALGLCGRAIYYYRKRENGSSTLDGSWTRPERFLVVPERGYLDLLRASAAASPTGRPARWAQRTVVYDIVWYLSVILGRPSTTAFLDDAEKARFKELLAEIFTWIDEDTIVDYDLPGCAFQYRLGMLQHWKGARPPCQRVFVDRYDEAQRLLRVRYFFCGELDREAERFSIGGARVHPAFEKTLELDLAGDPFVRERVVWLPVSGLEGDFEASIGDLETFVHVDSRDPQPRRPISDVVSALSSAELQGRAKWWQRAERSVATSAPILRSYRDALVFIDRDSRADDNAEHLYRYVLRHRPDLNAYFVLRRSSHDWDRLEREGFRLIEFGTLEHRIALVNAKHLISSQADPYVLAFPTVQHRRTRQRSRFTFLQHGVTKDDLSAWLNSKAIDCVVTASPAEHAYFVDPRGPYNLTEREVVLTGFPRHDALGAGDPHPDATIVVMPTWRMSLAGRVMGKTSERNLNPAFYESEFALRWKSFLRSDALRAVAEKHGYGVHFVPHPNLEPYLDWLEVPEFVVTRSQGAGTSMQEVMRSSALMVTDFSSTAFEMAYLRRPVLYYQFDRDAVFSGGHTTSPGYYDYDRDGFGPVCLDAETLLRELELALARRAVPAPEYLARMERALPLRDGQCCRRTLEAILDLDRPRTTITASKAS